MTGEAKSDPELVTAEQVGEVIGRLMAALEARRWTSDARLSCVRDGVVLLALRAGVEHSDARLLGLASVMRDIGLVAVPDSLLLKASAYTEEEWTAMRAHPELGARLLEGTTSRLIQVGQTIALTHHERWNGSGYPSGLTGEHIPFPSRVVALCDVFYAMVSPRRDRPPLSEKETTEFIRNERGVHFDPVLADMFLDALPELLAIRSRYRL